MGILSLDAGIDYFGYFYSIQTPIMEGSYRRLFICFIGFGNDFRYFQETLAGDNTLWAITDRGMKKHEGINI